MDDFLAHCVDFVTCDHIDEIFEEAFAEIVRKVGWSGAHLLLSLFTAELFLIVTLFHML